MNFRLEKAETFLVKQQAFLHQLLQSLQEVKPSDENWTKILKTLESQIPVFVPETDLNYQQNSQNDNIVQNKSALNDLRNEINILKENEKKYRIEFQNNNEAILKLQSSIQNISKQNRESAKSHNFIQAQLNLDQRLNEQAADLSIIKTMLKNQGDLWSEFDSTISQLVQDNGDESSNTKPNGKSANQQPQEKQRSQLLQCQIRNLTYEIKKVRQEISIFSDNQDKLAREKSLDIPNRVNKIISEIEQMKTTMMEMQEMIEDHQQNLNSIDSYHKIAKLEESEFQKETKQSFSTINEEISTIQTSIKATNDDLFILSDRIHTGESLMPTVKCLKHEIKQIKQQTQLNSTKSEGLQQRLNDLIRIIKQAKINQMKAQIRSVQEKSELTQKSIDQISTEIQQVNKTSTQLQENQKKIQDRTSKIESDEETHIKELKSIHAKLDQTQKEFTDINNSLKTHDDAIQQIFKDLQNSNLQTEIQDVKNQTEQLFKLLEGMNKRYTRDRSDSRTSINQIGISSAGPLSMSLSTLSTRDTFGLNSSGNGPDESDENLNTQNSSGLFDDISGPIQMRTQFDDFDDLVEGIQMITTEQNRQRKIIERLVDSMKANDIHYAKLKYHDKMIQEMRNRTSEHRDSISAIRNKQSTQEKNLQQVIKTVRYIETLNLGNELEVIKNQLRASNPPAVGKTNLDPSIQIDGFGSLSNLIANVQKNTKRIADLGKLYNTMDKDLSACQNDVEILKKGNPAFASLNGTYRKVRFNTDQGAKNSPTSQFNDDEAFRSRRLIKTGSAPSMLQNDPK